MHISCNTHLKSFTLSARRNGYPSKDSLGLAGEYAFVYNYPLSSPAMFTHMLTAKMTARDILRLGKADYENIYKEEDAAVGNTGNIPGMLNRSSSAGPYGIWGHHIEDLYFEGINIDDVNNIITFDIGS